MSNFNSTPLMGLPNPVPGVDPGPDYAVNIQSCFDIVDGHNHSAGSGNQINPSGIDINSDLPFNGNNATLLRSSRYSPQAAPLSAPTDLNCTYFSGVDLYANDGAGNQVRITSGGNVNATSSGISSGTASASFSGGVLIVDSNTNTPGNIKCGSVLIGDNSVGTNFVTVSAPASLGANYPLVLPTALPGAQSFMTLDASGNLATGVAYAGGLTTSNISTSAGILRSQLQAAGQQISSSCGNYTTTSATFTAITNLSVSITTSGRPVMVFLQDDGSGSQSYLNQNTGGTSPISINFSFFRGVTQLNNMLLIFANGQSGGTLTPSSLLYLDVPTAGTYTYTAQIKIVGGIQVAINRVVLVAYEI